MPAKTNYVLIDYENVQPTDLGSKTPRRKTLLSTLHALFKKELSQSQLSELFAQLRRRGIVKVEGTKVSYELPGT